MADQNSGAKLPAGIKMLLNTIGINGEEIAKEIETVKSALPAFATQMKATVESIESRLSRIEQNQLQILDWMKSFDEATKSMEASITAEVIQCLKSKAN